MLSSSLQLPYSDSPLKARRYHLLKSDHSQWLSYLKGSESLNHTYV